MSIYITGDTHAGIDINKLYTKNFPEGKKLTKSDYLIVAGDFGIWRTKRSEQFLDWINSKKWTTLFVEGNHEDYNFLKTFPLVDMFGSKVRKINDSVFQLLRGEVYEIDGLKVFTFGGARSIDKFLLNEGIDWFPEEECNYKEINYALNKLAEHENCIDLIITHTCASSTLEELSKLYGFYLEDLDSQNAFFEELKQSINYNAWFFGHMHKDLIINEQEVAIYNRVLKLDDFI